LAADGSVRHVLTTARDITDRKRAEQMLLEAHDELERRVARQPKLRAGSPSGGAPALREAGRPPSRCSAPTMWRSSSTPRAASGRQHACVSALGIDLDRAFGRKFIDG
jgi:hypothetical protein